MTTALSVRGLSAGLGDLEILKGVELEVPFGEIHALMGPNGSGKSTLCHALMGKPEYATTGSARVAGIELLALDVDERAAAGLFHAFQYPIEIPGVTLDELMAEMSGEAGEKQFAERVRRASDRLGMGRFRGRTVNVGLSGGETKRSELFQLAIASPKAAILDEIDSGLDIDAVREAASLVEDLRSPELGVLIITHYSRILRYMNPDRVHVMIDGRIVRSGGPDVAEDLESGGYEGLRAELGLGSPKGDDDPLVGL